MNIKKKGIQTVQITGLLFVACSLLFSVSACSDFLEIEPKEIIVQGKFWNEEADVENVVAGCYASMQSQAVIDRMMAWGEFRSDNIVGGTNIESNLDLSNIFKENINGSNAFAKWGEFYNIINKCNLVLRYAPEVAGKDPNYSPSELSTTQAEVTALRALMYFYLIRSFRDVPYITEAYVSDNQEMAIAATPFNEVLNSLIEDLEAVKDKAQRHYPSSKTYYQRGRITQEAIHAMLAEMYLWKQDYASAARYADMVIASKTEEYTKQLSKQTGVISSADQLIDGFPLTSDVFRTGNYYGNAYSTIFGSGNSEESIFELIYMNDDQMPANSSVSYRYGNSETFPGDVRPADFLCTDVNDEVFSVFKNKYDARYYENLQPINGSKTLSGISKYAFSSAMVDLSKATIQASYSGSYAKDLCHANWIIYRLSDVMLMKAEALVEMAGNNENQNENEKALADSLLNEAFKIVNAVSKRSNCSSSDKDLVREDYSTKALMQELVLEERQRELMFEGKRWYDLVRRARRDGNTNYLVGVVSRKGDSGGGALSSKLARMDALYWPYHNDELKVNNKLKQNPAFGSGENGSIERTK
jgi:hypothetical protein